MQRKARSVAIAGWCLALLAGGCWKMQEVWIPAEDGGTDTDTVDGVVVGAVHAGGGGEDASLALAALPDGSCYITGYIKLAATFGEGDPNETVLTPYGAALGDIFLARYNPDLTLDWAVIAGGEEGDAGLAVATLADGSAVITGYYRSNATFGGGGPNETVLDGTAGQKSIFIARYAADGDLAWVVRTTGGAAEVRGIAALPDGSVTVTGWFQESVTFGPGEPEQTTIYAGGSSSNTNGFIARYGGDGALAWVRRFGSQGSVVGNSVSADQQGAIYATGYFGDVATFGSGGPDSIEANALDAWDAFVVRYSLEGKPQWVTTGTGYFDLSGRAVSATPGGGGVLATGYFAQEVTFGQDEPAETTLQAAGPRDIFSARFDEDGRLDWVVPAGGTASDIETDVGRACAALGDGGGLVTGWFSGTAVFGGGQDEEESQLVSGGTKDAFVVRYRQDGQPEWVRRIGGPGEDRGYGLAPLEDGTFLVTGTFQGSVVFEEDDDVASEFTFSAQGNTDIFLARYLL